MIHRNDRGRYANTSLTDADIDAVADQVERRILDRFYPVPTWSRLPDGTIFSAGNDLDRTDAASLLELRWRVVWRHRLDPKAGIGYRIEVIDGWIQDARRIEDANAAAAESGISWAAGR